MTLREYLAALVYSSGPPVEARPDNGRPHERDRKHDRSLEPGTTRLVEAERSVVYECRRCGTTVDDASTACPHCDRRTIAEYPVD
ncbi:hypothetical protein [Halovivax limisalsi]|uniref:hypothetical protein n=1 Tax=Halovivax limisalsi TaxID=1453760 RepID=UPI001FFD4B88|nr:hypothetical protein [Halovivax limisalsi]